MSTTFFYNFIVHEFAPWFGLDEKFSASELRELGIFEIWDDDLQRPTALQLDEISLLVLWALYGLELVAFLLPKVPRETSRALRRRRRRNVF